MFFYTIYFNTINIFAYIFYLDRNMRNKKKNNRKGVEDGLKLEKMNEYKIKFIYLQIIIYTIYLLE